MFFTKFRLPSDSGFQMSSSLLTSFSTTAGKMTYPRIKPKAKRTAPTMARDMPR